MTNENKQKLDKVIEELMDHMKELDPSSEEYKRCTESLSMLIDRSNDERKIKDERRHRWISTSTTFGMRCIELAVFIGTVKEAWRYEGVATMTNEGGKKALSLLPRLLFGK